jgi:4'-phosphopantetheinyl transferase
VTAGRSLHSIHTDDVHVWSLRLDETVEAGREAELLSADELERAGRFRFEPDRNAFIRARAGLRRILSCYTGSHAAELQFAYGPHGKPLLRVPVPADSLAFNLSHSNHAALVAVGVDRPLGVDIEFMRSFPDLDGLAEKIFSQRELQAFRSLKTAERVAAFFRAWTRKEAFVKALGLGFSMPVTEVEVTFGPKQRASVVRLHGQTEAAREWTLRDLPVLEDYVGALAIQGPLRRVIRLEWPP